jgi:hypothetical protein
MSEISNPGAIGQSRTIESLHKALDQTYRHLLETAKTDWQRLFAGSDPGDDSVSVRISKEQIAEELAGTPTAALLHRQKKSLKHGGRRRVA